MITAHGLDAALAIVRAVGEAVRELRQVPEGVLYANLASHMSLAQFRAVVNILKDAGMVTVENHVVTWVKEVEKTP
jgi:hypothetical protein